MMHILQKIANGLVIYGKFFDLLIILLSLNSFKSEFFCVCSIFVLFGRLLGMSFAAARGRLRRQGRRGGITKGCAL